MSAFRLVRQYAHDLKHFPEIAPVTFIVLGAVTGATCFMPYKLMNTPDVTVNPAKPYHWQQYGASSVAK